MHYNETDNLVAYNLKLSCLYSVKFRSRSKWIDVSFVRCFLVVVFVVISRKVCFKYSIIDSRIQFSLDEDIVHVHKTYYFSQSVVKEELNAVVLELPTSKKCLHQQQPNHKHNLLTIRVISRTHSIFFSQL